MRRRSGNHSPAKSGQELAIKENFGCLNGKSRQRHRRRRRLLGRLHA